MEKLLEAVKHYIPLFMKPALRNIYYDGFIKTVGSSKIAHATGEVFGMIVERMREIFDPLTPSPKIAAFVGEGDYKTIGNEFKGYFIKLGQLRPDHKVLDVGCGIGRMAVPLVHYLSQRGEYWGFDIEKRGIDWCRSHITPRFPNFHFHLADVYNEDYNPDGKIAAHRYQFPYESGYFDFVFLTSVFTHMLPAEVENYFSEIRRVLKEDGKCLISYFLLNRTSEKLIDDGSSTLNFKQEFNGYRSIPGHAIAYQEAFIRDLYERYTFEILEPIYFGSWCGREPFLSYQDIVIGRKRSEEPSGRAGI